MINKKPADKPLAQLLGQRIAELRKSRQWTQAQLAERLQVEPETISRFERGASVPSLHTLESLAAILRVSIGDLLAQSSTAPDDQAMRISAWLSELEPADRAFVTGIVQQLCERLRSPSG
ncbi:helix-turn-helix transcriptional regulator [Comamonas piscis]|uniref:Helix-turn-helix transcriptional regulator n=1 Tax=Comamonas piscis TaxID=1562974 RepID=A0A7G5EBN8_9BURK|nr:helix-turn-helix transcriptional regulator [Comamonas piscis]QMV71413.1 helix-turn-helix transcriptional regulator [Comamonas piscis]WSO34121.1 helix-turn-helix transcriptional regulator [Comamonas piscis]